MAALPDPEGLRHHIIAEKSVPHGIAGLLRAFCSTVYAAVEANDFGPIKMLAEAISGNPKAWSDAVMANTPTAMETAGFAQGASYVGAPTLPKPVTEQQPAVSSIAPPPGSSGKDSTDTDNTSSTPSRKKGD